MAGFPRRAAAGLIDVAICLALTVVVRVGWLYSQFGLCECATEEALQDFLLVASLSAEKLAPGFFAIPSSLYFVWSWTPLAGRRSVGMRMMRIRAVIAEP